MKLRTCGPALVLVACGSGPQASSATTNQAEASEPAATGSIELVAGGAAALDQAFVWFASDSGDNWGAVHALLLGGGAAVTCDQARALVEPGPIAPITIAISTVIMMWEDDPTVGPGFDGVAWVRGLGSLDTTDDELQFADVRVTARQADRWALEVALTTDDGAPLARARATASWCGGW